MTRVRILTLPERRPVVTTCFPGVPRCSWALEKIAALAGADLDEVKCSDDNTVSVAGVPMFEIEHSHF